MRAKLPIILAALIVLSGTFTYLVNHKSSSAPTTAIVLNSISMDHNRLGHPENENRIKVTIDELKKQNIWQLLEKVEAREASNTELELAHDKSYIESVRQWVQAQKEPFLFHEKWAPYNSPAAYHSASTAAGGLIQLSEFVAQGKFKNGFALIRPPGHHALRSHGMGYCIFNNIVIAAKNLKMKNLANKILIVDIDAHHGNGLEEAFNGNPDFYYISLHQKIMFPYSGDISSENIHNYPLSFLQPELSHITLLKTALEESLKTIQPDFIFVSAGYDAHWRDYMSNLGLSLLGYAEISQALVQFADQHAAGKIVFSLEGGYDPEALAHGVTNSIKSLLGRTDFTDPIGKSPK